MTNVGLNTVVEVVGERHDLEAELYNARLDRAYTICGVALIAVVTVSAIWIMCWH